MILQLIAARQILPTAGFRRGARFVSTDDVLAVTPYRLLTGAKLKSSNAVTLSAFVHNATFPAPANVVSDVVNSVFPSNSMVK